jgi:pimeloyl-ACP methyl ester carboxylesterase
MRLSTDTPGDYTLLDLAADAAGLMTVLGIEHADVLGWSMGADVAKGLAVRYPGKIRRLVLYAASRGGPDNVPPSAETLKKITDTSRSRRRRCKAKVTPGATLVEMEGGHGVMYQDPEAFSSSSSSKRDITVLK